MSVNRNGRLNYTQKTLQHLRKLGCCVEKVEQFNIHAGPFGQKRDAFGFIDIIALDPQRGIIAIQSTGPNGHSEHYRTIVKNEFAKLWLECGGIIELWSWRKLLVKRGGALRRWEPRVQEITDKDYKQ